MVLPLVVSAAMVALRPRIVVAEENDEVALDFLASISARRGERRRSWLGMVRVDVKTCDKYCEEIRFEIEASNGCHVMVHVHDSGSRTMMREVRL